MKTDTMNTQSPPTTLSEERLRELKELREKATPWPWPDPDSDEDIHVDDEEMEHNRKLIFAVMRDLESLLHAAEQMARCQWQPIESAPRDGTEILTCDNGDLNVLYWSAGHWELHCNDGNWGRTPTHWMHLPPAPEKGGSV